MYCNACGCELPGDVRFCQKCGRTNPLIAGSPARRRLERPRDGRKIAGVCAGIANYLDIDPVLARLVGIVALFCGFGGIAYIVGWIIIPEEPVRVAQSLSTTEQSQMGA